MPYIDVKIDLLKIINDLGYKNIEEMVKSYADNGWTVELVGIYGLLKKHEDKYDIEDESEEAVKSYEEVSKNIDDLSVRVISRIVENIFKEIEGEE